MRQRTVLLVNETSASVSLTACQLLSSALGNPVRPSKRRFHFCPRILPPANKPFKFLFHFPKIAFFLCNFGKPQEIHPLSEGINPRQSSSTPERTNNRINSKIRAGTPLLHEPQ